MVNGIHLINSILGVKCANQISAGHHAPYPSSARMLITVQIVSNIINSTRRTQNIAARHDTAIETRTQITHTHIERMSAGYSTTRNHLLYVQTMYQLPPQNGNNHHKTFPPTSSRRQIFSDSEDWDTPRGSGTDRFQGSEFVISGCLAAFTIHPVYKKNLTRFLRYAWTPMGSSGGYPRTPPPLGNYTAATLRQIFQIFCKLLEVFLPQENVVGCRFTEFLVKICENPKHNYRCFTVDGVTRREHRNT